jgi:hypothetical protein
MVPDPIAVGIDSAGKTLFWIKRPIIKIVLIAGMSSVNTCTLTEMPRDTVYNVY